MEKINTVANYIMFYIENRDTNVIIEENVFKKLCRLIAEIFSCWPGETYGGCKKDSETQNIFQKFF